MRIFCYAVVRVFTLAQELDQEEVKAMLSSDVINKRHGLMRVCHTFSEYLLRAAVAFSKCERVRARRLQTISNQVWPRTAAKQFKSMADNFTIGIAGRCTQEACVKG